MSKQWEPRRFLKWRRRQRLFNVRGGGGGIGNTFIMGTSVGQRKYREGGGREREI